MAITIYGIKNCDTMKKARAWLDKRGIDYSFHDYKTAGIDNNHLVNWAKVVGWEVLLNRAGATFRKLPGADKENLTEKKALSLMLAQPSMIKRPVIENGSKLLVGFKPDVYEAAFKKNNAATIVTMIVTLSRLLIRRVTKGGMRLKTFRLPSN